jgi:F420-dependent oxidoreductase-like protein
MTGPLRFGAFVPQGWKLEYTGVGAADAWARSIELAKEAEALGYDHIWVYDHVETVPRREPSHMFEAFTMLAALSQQTSTIQLGQLVTCVGYRNVGLLAKEAACVDVYSGGRLILGLGAGWYHQEYGAYGYDYPSDGQRLGHLREALEVIPRLWSDETVTYAGDHVRFDGAYCDPKPTQARPPILVGGGGEKVTLKLAAQHADLTNWQVGLDEFIHKSAVLEQHCASVGRPIDDIVRTHGPDCAIFDTDAECRAWCATADGGNLWNEVTDVESYLRDNLVGTVEQVIEKTQGFVDAGCREFILWFRDFPSSSSMQRFLAEVAPALRTSET